MRNLKKIQKNLKDNPEILDQVLTGLDSFASIKKEDIPSFDEVYGDIIKDPYINKQKSNQKIKPFSLKKVILIPVGICIVLTVFFITPAGKAFAENISRTVVQWFDSGVSIQYGKGDLNDESDQPISTNYDSIQSVRDATKQQVAWNKDNRIQGKISATQYGAELQIVTKYLSQENSEITITQTIITEGESGWGATISSDGGTAVDVVMPDGSHFIGYVNDDYCTAINYQSNASIEVFSEDSEYDSFIKFIKGILVE